MVLILRGGVFITTAAAAAAAAAIASVEGLVVEEGGGGRGVLPLVWMLGARHNFVLACFGALLAREGGVG
jgi:hypothetical protein